MPIVILSEPGTAKQRNQVRAIVTLLMVAVGISALVVGIVVHSLLAALAVGAGAAGLLFVAGAVVGLVGVRSGQ